MREARGNQLCPSYEIASVLYPRERERKKKRRKGRERRRKEDRRGDTPDAPLFL